MNVHYDLIHPDVSLHIDGEPDFQTLDHVHGTAFRGEIFSERFEETTKKTSLGWSNIVFHDLSAETVQFEGMFMVDGDMHQVKLAKHYERSKRPADMSASLHDPLSMVVTRESDKSGSEKVNLNHDKPHRCGTDDLKGNADVKNGASAYYDTLVQEYMDNSQQTSPANVFLKKRAPSGCPSTKKILYLGMAADCTYVKHYGGAAEALERLVLDISQASQIYGNTFNIELGIVHFDILRRRNQLWPKWTVPIGCLQSRQFLGRNCLDRWWSLCGVVCVRTFWTASLPST